MSSITISVVIINVQLLSAYWAVVKDREAWRPAVCGVTKSLLLVAVQQLFPILLAKGV